MGRLGSSLATSLRALGHRVAERRRDTSSSLAAWSASLSVICLTVRDDELAELVTVLATTPLAGKTVLLFSGATPLSLLTPLQAAGGVIGKLHPLQTFAQKDGAPMPAGTHYAYEGEIEALVRPWVAAWSGHLHHLVGDQWARYHAAAVTAANFLPLLIRCGAELLEPLADDRGDALDWLKPLIQNSVANALDGALDLPYSGPAVRGDVGVLQRQAALLDEIHPEAAALYRLAGRLVAARAGYAVFEAPEADESAV